MSIKASYDVAVMVADATKRRAGRRMDGNDA